MVGAFAFGPLAFIAAGPVAAAFGVRAVLGFGAAWAVFGTLAVLAAPAIRNLTWQDGPPAPRPPRAGIRLAILVSWYHDYRPVPRPVDLAAIGGLIVLIVVTALRLRPSLPPSPAWHRLALDQLDRVLAALGLVVLGNAWLAIAATTRAGRPRRRSKGRGREAAVRCGAVGWHLYGRRAPGGSGYPAGEGERHPPLARTSGLRPAVTEASRRLTAPRTAARLESRAARACPPRRTPPR